MIAASSQKAISTVFGCEHASGSEVHRCFYTSHYTKDMQDPRFSLMHTFFTLLSVIMGLHTTQDTSSWQASPATQNWM